MNESRVIRRADGMSVQFVDKKGFCGTYTAVSVEAGGNDRRIAAGGAVRPILPGAAHFLEHLVFSGRDQALGRALARRGISANAMTKHEETIYYASATGDAGYTVDVLLDAVAGISFSDEDVQKEKAIILSEIDMLENDPSYALQEKLLRAMYPVHPVQDDIGGTQDDVRGLHTEALHAFHQTYYAGGRIRVTVAGDLSVSMQDAIAQRAFAAFPENRPDLVRPFVVDDAALTGETLTVTAPVELPQFALGIKIDPALWPADPAARYLKHIQLAFWLETYFGRISPEYDRLVMDDLIDDGFHYGLWQGSDFAALFFFGHSRQPEAAAARIGDRLEHLLSASPSEDLFELIRKAALGKLLRRHDSVKRIGAMAASMLRHGIDVFSLPAQYAKIELPTADALSRHIASPAYRQTVILLPGSQ